MAFKYSGPPQVYNKQEQKLEKTSTTLAIAATSLQLAKDWKRLNRTSLLHNSSFWTNPPTMEQFTKDWKRTYLYHNNRFKDETRRINVDINKQSKALLSNKMF
ncbi:hypothetical protein OS493_033707 [Desmophyllum pertusum]|uniref:Uncharacterized protein n=1 Tax=Desmophyllum pertusum TaxID=174260 RepID=A0A9W9ZJ23_9CNID|nr:hypothetical protein OS493_033707 [Desmophyllum pertusum]